MNIERITKIYDELDEYSIELDADPTTLGPQYLGKVISQCRNFLNRTTRFLLEVRRERHMTSNQLSAEEAAFKIESDALLAGDERVRSRPNIRDREAVINVILSERANRIIELENALRNLDAVEGAIKIRHSDLVRTDGQIKTQRSLIRDELDTKSYLGDEFSNPRPSDVNEAELADIMSGYVAPPLSPASISSTLFEEPSAPLSSSIHFEDRGLVVEFSSVSCSEEAPVSEVAPEVESVQQSRNALDEALASLVAESVGPPAKAVEAKAVEVKAVEAKAVEVKAVEAKAVEVKAGEAKAVDPASDLDVMNQFLDADPVASESKPVAKGRKTAPKKKDSEEIVTAPPAMEADADFLDILAGL